jgi:hypothetical protein
MPNSFFNPYLREYLLEKRGDLLFTHHCESGTIVDVHRAVNGPPGLLCVPDWRGAEPLAEDIVEWSENVVPQVRLLLAKEGCVY